ncbi:MAG TPA: hypothetical protein VK116_12590, partial [Planctomycetota bacterium]|nr:hypothetical protein [Planctomycetota bacterium]
MSKSIQLQAVMSIGDSCSGSNGSLGNQCALGFGLGVSGCNGGRSYPRVIQSSFRVETLAGVFDRLESLDEFSAIELLFLRTSSDAKVRINARAAFAQAAGGSYPTGFTGGETLDIERDGVTIPVVFTSGAQLAANVVTEINVAAAQLGLETPIATLVNGQIRISGKATKLDPFSGIGVVQVSGSAAAQLGFTSPDAILEPAAGVDLPI